MPGPEGKFLVVGVHLRTPIDYAREMDRAMHYYAHVVACLAEVADPQRRSFLESRQGEVLEELAARGIIPGSESGPAELASASLQGVSQYRQRSPRALARGVWAPLLFCHDLAGSCVYGKK